MPDRRLSNARVQEWLVADLDRVSEQMDSSKALVKSAAIWWFCLKLEPTERARILGEFVTAMALRGNSVEPSDNGKPSAKPARKPKID